jgi:hypothetical protein
MTFRFSRRLAILAGIALPLGETVRRWHQLAHLSMWPAWLDDILLGAFLLYAAWRVGRDHVAGQRFFGQLARLDQPDPSSLPSTWVVLAKGLGLLLAIAALIDSLRPLERHEP